jgi:uncharacterized protein (TIGR03435 family)
MSGRPAAACVLIALSCAPIRAQQTTGSAPKFDVVSIKPTISNRGGGPGPFVTITAGRLFARGPLQFFLLYAFGLQPFQLVGGPRWMAADRFDLEAKEAPGEDNYSQFPQMLRPILSERFTLQTHRETRQMGIYRLVVARGGATLKPPVAGDGSDTRGGIGQLVAKRMSMRALASRLSLITSRQVVDRTRLDGEFAFTLMWTPDEFQRPDPLGRPPADQTGTSLYTALQEQLGLRLDAGTGPVEVLVVDGAQRPSEN